MQTVAMSSLRLVTTTAALVGIVGAVGLFIFKSHTSTYTIGSFSGRGASALGWASLVLGLLTVTLAMIDLVRSRGHWLPLAAVVVGTLTWASVLFVGYPA